MALADVEKKTSKCHGLALADNPSRSPPDIAFLFNLLVEPTFERHEN